jgi:enterochelin esterase-like enzyme
MSLQVVQELDDGLEHGKLAGALDQVLVHSEALEGNPLGDSPCRLLYVYRPPAWRAECGQRLPTVYLLQGFAGQLRHWLEPDHASTSIVERIDAMFAAERCPRAVVVFVDGWNSRGGSQFLNSSSTGRYLDYLCDEIVPFVDGRYSTHVGRGYRGVVGKSSGGYGAVAAAMLRPDLFGGVVSLAGDALFECCYQPLFPVAARMLRDEFESSWEVFTARATISNAADLRRFAILFAAYAVGCAYAPDPERPGAALMPFEPRTGRLILEVWERWLAFDPVRMAQHHAEALTSLRLIHLEAGRQDEFFLDLGAQALSHELTRLGIAHSLELFDGDHEAANDRHPDAIRKLALSLR